VTATPLPATLRRLIRERAALRCEYCLLAEDDAFLPHESDHIIAAKHGGATEASNLALACFDCNRFKGTDLSSIDPETGQLTPLFNPRSQDWPTHFASEGGVIIPRTPSARVTVKLLRLNLPVRVEVRSELAITSKEATGTGIDFIDEATNNPLVDQRGWYVVYDIRLSQSEFTYLTKNGYYDAKNQIAAFPATGPSTFVGLPRTGQETDLGPPLPAYAQFGALEVKTAWRVLDPKKDTVSRFYTQTGYFMQPDGKTCQGPVLFGLVGLHILRLTPTTPSTWYWASFEQVDNTSVPTGSTSTPSLAAPGTPNGSCTAAYNVAPAEVTGNIPWNNTSKPVNACQVTNLPADLVAENTRWQQQAPVKGTVWQNYQLVGTLNPSVAGGPAFNFPNNTTATVNVNTMANVAIETYSQAGSKTPSCMSCHGFAAPDGAPTNPLTSTNQIFTFILGNADSSVTPGLRKRGARHLKKH
jgi:hypothetical protein